MEDIDWENPCARYKALNAAYFRIISGQQESQIQYLANGVTRTVMYSQANIKELIGEVRAAEADCAAKNGLAKPRRRFAIQGGSRGY